jgi:hypothetical protein
MVIATRRWAALGLVVAIWACAWLSLMAMRGHSVVAIAAAFDFIVTACAAMYFVAVRGGHLPRWTLVATFAVGMVFARLAVMRSSGHVVIALGIVLELGMVASLIVRGRSTLAARVLSTELRVMASVVTGWRRPEPAFTVHRANDWNLYAGVVGFLILVEASVVHIVLATTVSTLAAWIATALSIYSAVWVLGDALALRHGGVRLRGDELEIRIGLRWRTLISRADVVAVEGPASDALDLSILGANTVLRLRCPVRVDGMFGRVRHANAIALSLDDREGFIAAVALWSARP